VVNRLNSDHGFGTELSRSLTRILAAVIERARRNIGTPSMESATAELRRIFSLGLRCQSVLRVSVVRAGSASGGKEEEAAVHSLGSVCPETLAREAGVAVRIGSRPLAPPGKNAPEALEQALLLTHLGSLATESHRLGSNEDPLAGFVWTEGAPMGRTVLPNGKTVTIVAARQGDAGRGLGFATAIREEAAGGALRGNSQDLPSSIRTTITLLVPHLQGPDAKDPSPHAWVVQLTA